MILELEFVKEADKYGVEYILGNFVLALYVVGGQEVVVAVTQVHFDITSEVLVNVHLSINQGFSLTRL